MEGGPGWWPDVEVCFQFPEAVLMATVLAFDLLVLEPVKIGAVAKNASSSPDKFGNHVFSYHALIFGPKVNQSP